MLRALIVYLMLWSGALRAEDAGLPVPDPEGAIVALMQSLPDKTIKKLRDAPERFVDTAAGLILGFGGSDGIDRAGIDRFIAVERANQRTRAMRRVLQADLDNDGVTTRAEMAALVATAGAAERGRLDLAFRRADTDRDGTVPMAELRAHAQLMALKDLPAADADTLRGLMDFDMDSNGRVTLDEVFRVVAALEKKL